MTHAHGHEQQQEAAAGRLELTDSLLVPPELTKLASMGEAKHTRCYQGV